MRHKLESFREHLLIIDKNARGQIPKNEIRDLIIDIDPRLNNYIFKNVLADYEISYNPNLMNYRKFLEDIESYIEGKGNEDISTHSKCPINIPERPPQVPPLPKISSLSHESPYINTKKNIQDDNLTTSRLSDEGKNNLSSQEAIIEEHFAQAGISRPQTAFDGISDKNSLMGGRGGSRGGRRLKLYTGEEYAQNILLGQPPRFYFNMQSPEGNVSPITQGRYQEIEEGRSVLRSRGTRQSAQSSARRGEYEYHAHNGQYRIKLRINNSLGDSDFPPTREVEPHNEETIQVGGDTTEFACQTEENDHIKHTLKLQGKYGAKTTRSPKTNVNLEDKSFDTASFKSFNSVSTLGDPIESIYIYISLRKTKIFENKARI